MDELEEKLGSILKDPQLMQQIGALAQSLGNNEGPPPEGADNFFPDPGTLRKLANFAGSGAIDQKQTALVHALAPYISQERAVKLERAMRAARVAKMASSFLDGGGASFFTGR